MRLNGMRKFIVVLANLFVFLLLSSLAVYHAPQQAIGIIGSVGAGITAISIPFVTGNAIEHKEKTKAVSNGK